MNDEDRRIIYLIEDVLTTFHLLDDALGMEGDPAIASQIEGQIDTCKQKLYEGAALLVQATPMEPMVIVAPDTLAARVWEILQPPQKGA